MLASENDEARAWGSRAIALAERLGDDAVRAHALVNVASVEVVLEPDDERPVFEAFRVADAAGEHHEATRALLNLAFRLMEANQLERAGSVSARALAYADEHEVYALAHYVAAMLARVDVLAGRWADAEGRLRDILASGGSVARLLALSTLALLQVRSSRRRRSPGDPGPRLGAGN